MTAGQATPTQPPQPFPRPFWVANVTELFERAAYYSMASFVVSYLGRLGLGKQWPSNLNSVLWFLVYFLPILSGTIADVIGFRLGLIIAGVLLAVGYFLMGSPVWLFGAELSQTPGDAFTAGPAVLAPVLVAIVLIGIGGSFVKPCISGTVQKTHAGRATLAFAIFYMVINIGSLVGRGVAYVVRRGTDLSYIFAVAAVAALVVIAVVVSSYRDPDRAPGTPERPKKTLRDVFLGMFRVLKNKRFVLFLLVSSGFWFLYNQVYNVLPLYTERVLQIEPPMEIYTAFNPITIVAFQLLITRAFGKMKPIRSIVVGTVIIALAMVANLLPIFTPGGPRVEVLDLLPLGSLFIVLTVTLIAFGELFTSARTYEWIGALAPKGQEGLFLGYANLPMAIGSLVGGPVGALIFNDVMRRDAVTLPNKLLDLDPFWSTLGWLIFMTIGFGSALSMWLYNRWLERQPREDTDQAAAA